MGGTRARPARVRGRSTPFGVAVAAVALVAAAPAPELPYAPELARVDASLRSGEAPAAVERCEKLARRIYRELVRTRAGTGSVSAAFYAELSTRCAVAAAASGDARAASWLWHGAQMLDSQRAAAVAPELESLATLPSRRSLHRLSAAASAGDGGAPGSAVRPSREPALLPRQHLPSELARASDGCRLGVELVVGADGRPREPVALFAEECAPTQLFFWLRAVAAFEFRPARLGGDDVDSLFTITTTFRDLPATWEPGRGDGPDDGS